MNDAISTLSVAAIEFLAYLRHRRHGDADLGTFGGERWEYTYADCAAIVETLERRGLVRDQSTFGSIDARLTGSGIETIDAIAALRENPGQRIPELRRKMLLWLYRRSAENPPTRSWLEFLDDDESQFLADRFKAAEVRTQGEYLRTRQLISSIDIEDESPGFLRPQLTLAGQECVVDFGGNVSDYLKRGDGGGSIFNTYNVADNRGNLTIGGSNFSQNISEGIDTSQLLKFAGAVRQLLPTLGLEEAAADELAGQAEELHSAASEKSPDVGRIRALWSAIMQGITKAAPTVAGELVTNLGNEAIRAIGS